MLYPASEPVVTQVPEPAAESARARFVITLVNGTWAPHAPWMQTDSPFCRQLEAELKKRGATGVTILSLSWRGRNTHQERRTASVQLRRHLLAQLLQDQSARHYVIAHSHGGNVALRAVCGSPTLRRELQGIVAIATPFLAFVQQSFRLALVRPALKNAVKIVVALILSYAFSIVGALLLLSILVAGLETLVEWVLDYPFSAWSEWGWAYYKWGGPVVGAAASALILYYGWEQAKDESIGMLQAESSRVFRRYSYFQPEARLANTRVLVLSSALDEAYSVLVGSWWMHRVTGWGIRLAVGCAIGLALTLVVAMTFVYYSGTFLPADAVKSLGWAGLVDRLAAFAVAGVFCLVIIVAYCLVEAFIQIGERMSPGLGLSDPADNIVCNVRARRGLPAPIQATSKRYGIWQLARHAKGVLFHSRIYAHPPAIQDIAEWLSR